MTSAIEIRPASIDDACDLLDIERACPETPHWSEAIWARTLTQSSMHDPRYAPESCCLVAEHNGEAVGFLVVHLVAGCAEIESLAVLPFARRHGVATALYEQAVLFCSSYGVASIQLEVRASNAAASGLYTRLGFIEQGRRRGYYRDPPEDAVLLGISLSDAGNRTSSV